MSLFPTWTSWDSSLAIASALSYCHLKSPTALHLRAHAGGPACLLLQETENVPRSHLSSQLPECASDQASLGRCTALCQGAGAGSGDGPARAGWCFDHSTRWEVLWKRVAFSIESPEAEWFCFLLDDKFSSTN